MKWNLRYCLIVVYNKIVLTKTYQLCRNYVFRFRYKHLPKSYESIRNNLIEKKKINVAFFIHDAAKWKYEGVYRCFEKDERFNPYIVIVPFAAGSVTGYNVEENMMKTYSYFKTTHKVCLPYDANSKKIFDIRGTEFEPDLIFYMNCWHEYGKYKQFSYRHNWDKLQAYVPYAWMISARYIEHFNRDFHNCMWKIFYETPLHVNMSKQYAINKGINAVSSGYPMLDVFFDSNYVPNDSIWKKQGKRKKRIIWAPHHHIYEKNRCANFLFVYDLMIQLAKKYENEVQFIFRPHPELAKKLDFCVSGWNEQKRKEYYSVWENMPNTQIELGDYIDMFLTSLIEDIYIHERNFFDEANEPMNSRDVLEEISKYIGMTFIQYQDAYYMIDYDFIKNDELHFFVYDRISDTCESITIPSALLNVRNIGVSESAGSISLGDV